MDFVNAIYAFTQKTVTSNYLEVSTEPARCMPKMFAGQLINKSVLKVQG